LRHAWHDRNEELHNPATSSGLLRLTTVARLESAYSKKLAVDAHHRSVIFKTPIARMRS
jgi:hypothetical protein